MRLSDQSAGSLAWFAVLLLVPGLLIESPTGRIAFIGLAALFALIPAIFGSMKRRIFGGIVFAICIAIGIPTFFEHDKTYTEYLNRAKQRESPPQPPVPGKSEATSAPR